MRTFIAASTVDGNLLQFLHSTAHRPPRTMPQCPTAGTANLEAAPGRQKKAGGEKSRRSSFPSPFALVAFLANRVPSAAMSACCCQNNHTAYNKNCSLGRSLSTRAGIWNRYYGLFLCDLCFRSKPGWIGRVPRAAKRRSGKICATI